MSSSSWIDWLANHLEKKRPVDLSPRIAVIGIGNTLNGDDGAGVAVVRALRRAFYSGELPGAVTEIGRILLVEAETAPEAFTGVIRRFQPEWVILVDAANLGEPGGAVQVFDWSEATGMSASTHTLPPSILAHFLLEEIHCRVVILGIQPETLEFDRPISSRVRASVEQVSQVLLEYIQP